MLKFLLLIALIGGTFSTPFGDGKSKKITKQTFNIKFWLKSIIIITNIILLKFIFLYHSQEWEGSDYRLPCRMGSQASKQHHWHVHPRELCGHPPRWKCSLFHQQCLRIIYACHAKLPHGQQRMGWHRIQVILRAGFPYINEGWFYWSIFSIENLNRLSTISLLWHYN